MEPQAPRTLRTVLEDPLAPAAAAAELTQSQWAQMQSSLTYQKCPASRIARLDGPARTLISSYKGGSSYYAEVVAEESDGTRRDGESRPRFFTARECCRIMGFPESYRIPGDPLATTGAACQDHQHFYRQIGNAVCVPVITAIAREIFSALEAVGVVPL